MWNSAIDLVRLTALLNPEAIILSNYQKGLWLMLAVCSILSCSAILSFICYCFQILLIFIFQPKRFQPVILAWRNLFELRDLVKFSSPPHKIVSCDWLIWKEAEGHFDSLWNLKTKIESKEKKIFFEVASKGFDLLFESTAAVLVLSDYFLIPLNNFKAFEWLVPNPDSHGQWDNSHVFFTKSKSLLKSRNPLGEETCLNYEDRSLPFFLSLSLIFVFSKESSHVSRFLDLLTPRRQSPCLWGSFVNAWGLPNKSKSVWQLLYVQPNVAISAYIHKEEGEGGLRPSYWYASN